MKPLGERIKDDLKESVIAREPLKTSVLRLLLSALRNAEIAQKREDLNDQKIQALISRQIAQREESASAFTKGNRPELAQKELAEIAVLKAYLPAQMEDTDLQGKILELLSREGLASKKDFGKAMKLLQEALKGQADNRRISAFLNQHLK